MPAKNYASTRYSGLEQINTGNVANLKLAWSFSTGVNRGQEAAPIVAGSTIYVVTPYPNILYALDLTKPGAPASHAQVKNEYEQNGPAISDGKLLYEWFNCVGCHAHGGGGMGPALMDDEWIYGNEPGEVFAPIVEGCPNGMPSFRDKIPDYQVWQLAAFVRSPSGQVPKDAASGRYDNMSIKKPESQTDTKEPKASTLPKSAEMPK